MCWFLFFQEGISADSLLQAKCRLALDTSDIGSEPLSEPVHRRVYNLKPAVGGLGSSLGSLLAPK